MKRIFLLILITNFTALALDQPSKDQVIKAIEKIKILHFEENNINRHAQLIENGELRFIKDKFTANNRPECLVIVPVEAGPYYIEWLVLMYKNPGGYWTYANWFRDNQNRIDLIDIDNDGIKEIIAENTGMAQGYIDENYWLISLKNETEEILYQNESFDYSAGAFVQDKKIGDIISKTIEVNYIDLNNDGIKEIIELAATGLFQYYSENEGVDLKYTKEKNTYHLVNGKYVIKK